jgi:hypothetical protein
MSAQRAFLRSLPPPTFEAEPKAANNFPQPPVMAENGQQFAAQPGEHAGICRADSPDEAGISFQADCAGGNLPGAESLGEELRDLNEVVVRKVNPLRTLESVERKFTDCRATAQLELRRAGASQGIAAMRVVAEVARGMARRKAGKLRALPQ